MDLNAESVARLLGVSEERVIEMARTSELPSFRLDGQYRFNSVELQEWAVAHGRRVAPAADAAGASARPALYAALRRGAIHYRVAGQNREEVLAAVTNLPQIPPSVDRGLLYQLLVSRESLASTGVGHGIAIPHPRDPLVVRLDEAVLLLCFLAEPIDFGAVDNQPVRIVFTLLAPTIRQHLQLLARLAWCLHDEALNVLLVRAAPEAEILARFEALEREATRPAGTP